MRDHPGMVGDPTATRASGAPTEVDRIRLQTAVLDWYAAHGRVLVIRRSTDPYAIWIAETMSQQTQIGRVGEALPAFLDAFPDVPALAAAPVAELLRAWGGLGYPRRALAMRAAARDMVARWDGRVPGTVEELESLPGVGPYTARAVASTAFGVPVTALDVNARRVLGRVLGGASTGRSFQSTADELAPFHRSADWNHALMDLGATICRPSPDCLACPLRSMCAWVVGRPVSANAPARKAGVPFRDTNRYVRGRVLATLRDLPPGTWHLMGNETLSIDPVRIERALDELHHEGLLELDEHGRARLPLT